MLSSWHGKGGEKARVRQSPGCSGGGRASTRNECGSKCCKAEGLAPVRCGPLVRRFDPPPAGHCAWHGQHREPMCGFCRPVDHHGCGRPGSEGARRGRGRAPSAVPPVNDLTPGWYFPVLGLAGAGGPNRVVRGQPVTSTPMSARSGRLDKQRCKRPGRWPAPMSTGRFGSPRHVRRPGARKAAAGGEHGSRDPQQAGRCSLSWPAGGGSSVPSRPRAGPPPARHGGPRVSV